MGFLHFSQEPYDGALNLDFTPEHKIISRASIPNQTQNTGTTTVTTLVVLATTALAVGVT